MTVLAGIRSPAREPDGPGKRVGKVGEFTLIAPLKPGRAEKFRQISKHIRPMRAITKDERTCMLSISVGLASLLSTYVLCLPALPGYMAGGEPTVFCVKPILPQSSS